MIKKSTKICFEFIGGVIAGLMILALVIGLRLAAGPWPMNFLNDYVIRAISPAGSPVKLSIEQTQLEWDSSHHAVTLRVKSLRAVGQGGETLANFPDMSVSISLLGLLNAKIAPSRITLFEPSISVIRHMDGRFDLAGAPMPDQNAMDVADTNRLVKDMIAALAGKSGVEGGLGYLRVVEIQNGEVILDDQKNGVTFWAPRVNLELLRSRLGLFGNASAQVELNENRTELQADLSYPKDSQDIVITSKFSNIDLTNVVSLLPELHEFGFLQAPVSGQMRFALGADLTVRDVGLLADGGEGKIVRPDFFENPIAVKAVHLDLNYDNMGNVRIKKFSADFGGMTLDLAGDLQPIDAGHRLAAKLVISNLDIENLANYWPSKLAENPRSWVLPNVTAGQVPVAEVELTAASAVEGAADFKIESLSGRLQFQNATVDYLNPLPKASGVSGNLTADTKKLYIETTGGAAGGVQLGSGKIVIDGLDALDQTIDIDIGLSGALTDALAVIDHEPLRLPSKRNISPQSVRGDFRGNFKTRFPLVKELKIEQVKIDATAESGNAFVDNAFRDLPLSRAQMKIMVTNHDMEIAGQGYLAGLPLDVLWQEDFRDKPEKFKSRYMVRGVFPDLAFDIFQLPRPIPISGTVDIEADYQVFDIRQSRAIVKADLEKTAIAVPEINWWKPAGLPANGRMDVNFTDGNLVGIPHFSVAAKSVLIEGDAEFAPNNVLDRLNMNRIQTENNNARLSMRRDGEKSYAVALAGSKFDAAHIYRMREEPDTPKIYAVDMDLARLSLGGAADLYQVKSRQIFRGGELQSLRLAAATETLPNRFTPFEASIAERRLTAKSDDAGGVLRALDLYDSMYGGKLSAEGVFDDATKFPVLNGKFMITDFSVKNAPVLAQLLNLSSLSGILENMGGQGIGFDKFTSDFTRQKDLVTIKNLRANGSSIGIKASGTIDNAKRYYDIEGILIPANDINKIISNIPLIGTILTAGGEQPLLAFNYRVKGSLAAPQVSVNPLSALTPGILREIFGGGQN